MIVQLNDREATLKKNANTDTLTGLNNRRAFNDHITGALHLAKRLGVYISVHLIDIDYFKKYNDTYGHLQGDVCLAEVAAAISSSVTRSNDFVARYGGEEFVVITMDANEESSLTLGEKIRLAVGDLDITLKEDPRKNTKVTASIGICSVIPKTDTTVDEILKAADVALYRSKSLGRNRVTKEKL